MQETACNTRSGQKMEMAEEKPWEGEPAGWRGDWGIGTEAAARLSGGERRAGGIIGTTRFKKLTTGEATRIEAEGKRRRALRASQDLINNWARSTGGGEVRIIGTRKQ